MSTARSRWSPPGGRRVSATTPRSTGGSAAARAISTSTVAASTCSRATPSTRTPSGCCAPSSTSCASVYLLRLRHALAGVDVIRRRFAEAQRGAGRRARRGDRCGPRRSTSRTPRPSPRRTSVSTRRTHRTSAPAIARHREEVAAIVAGCVAIAIAGGHVGVLNDCLHLCNLAALIEERPLLAWSSGCMAVSERIVVVDDDDPAGRPDELYDIGIGVARGMVALPAAASRLRAHDPDRLAVLARRCAPSVVRAARSPAIASSCTRDAPPISARSAWSPPTAGCCGGRRPPDREPRPSPQSAGTHPPAQRGQLPRGDRSAAARAARYRSSRDRRARFSGAGRPTGSASSTG